MQVYVCGLHRISEIGYISWSTRRGQAAKEFWVTWSRKHWLFSGIYLTKVIALLRHGGYLQLQVTPSWHHQLLDHFRHHVMGFRKILSRNLQTLKLLQMKFPGTVMIKEVLEDADRKRDKLWMCSLATIAMCVQSMEPIILFKSNCSWNPAEIDLFSSSDVGNLINWSAKWSSMSPEIYEMHRETVGWLMLHILFLPTETW